MLLKQMTVITIHIATWHSALIKNIKLKIFIENHHLPSIPSAWRSSGILRIRKMLSKKHSAIRSWLKALCICGRLNTIIAIIFPISPKTTKIEPTTPNRAHFHATNAYLIKMPLVKYNENSIAFYTLYRWYGWCHFM